VEFGSLILDNVQFLGPTDRTCDRCADAVETSMVNTTANNVTGTNLDYVFYSNYGSLTVTSSTFTDTYSGIMTYCGSVTVDNLSSTNSQYHVESDGCFGGSGGAVGPQLAFADDYPDVLTVTNSAFSTGYQGIDSYQMTAVVANNTLRNVDYPIDHYAGPITIADNVMTDPKGTAIDFDLVFDSLLAEVQRNTITCDPLIAYSVWAIRGFDGEMNIADNVVTNCYQGIDASSGFLAVPLPLRIANNTVTIPSGGRGGIEADGASARVAIVGNAVSGPGYWGSIYAGSHISTPYAVVDSNVITGSLAAGIWSRDVDSLFIRDNSVTDNGGAGCCFSPGSAILVSTGNATALAHQVLRNSVVNSATHGITIAVGFSDTVTTLVDSNTVKGSGQYGIWVSTGAAIIRKNAVDSTGSDGVRVSTTDSVLVNQNNITRSTGYGVNNTSGILLNATSNWWGDALGPGGSLGDISSSGDSVSANVTFSPFLTAINGGVPLPAAFWAPIAFTSAVPAGHDIPPRYERRERLFETDVIESEEITVPDRNRLFTDLTESVRDLDERTAARRLAALETRQARRQAQAIRNQERVDRRNARIAELEARRAARRADGGAQ
ncbi:MAG: right-handed parallel beta-helix repeat-containing protein, partial [Gemmatimonadales bacterium]